MLPEGTQPISVDDHLNEPPNLWQSRLPSKYHEAGPRVVRLDSGVDAWQYQGKVDEVYFLSASAGMGPEAFTLGGTTYEQMRPGFYDPKERLADMDLDGVWGAVQFPTFPRFAGHRFIGGKDRDLALLCCRAWNDYIHDEWCATAPDRFIPMGILPLWDVDLCVAEVERLSTLGFRAIAFSENPTKLRLPSIHTRHWDPLFRAIEASDLAICMHIGSSTEVVNSSADAPYPVHVGLVGLNSMIACADWLFSHIFHEFPKLRVSLSEGGAGWAPWLAERCDFAWERHAFHSGVSRDRRPSELLQEHIWLCMIQDDLALELRERIGVEKIMWECDYPHSDSLWPHSVTALEKSLAGVPAEQAKLIAEGNARQLFRFPRST